jgi:hypothetical protein
MGRQKPQYAGTTWADVALAVEAWEVEHRVRVVVQVQFRRNLTAGAFVEVVLQRLAGEGAGVELCRVREAFPARAMSGQAGAVMHAVFRALMEFENNPWLWSDEQRARARGEA